MATVVQDEWQALETFPNHLGAEIVAGILRAQSVPVRIESFGVVPGLEQGSRLMVPAPLILRARWLLAQAKVSDAELDYMATGKLTEP
jgi:hypothetical protein